MLSKKTKATLSTLSLFFGSEKGKLAAWFTLKAVLRNLLGSLALNWWAIIILLLRDYCSSVEEIVESRKRIVKLVLLLIVLDHGKKFGDWLFSGIAI